MRIDNTDMRMMRIYKYANNTNNDTKYTIIFHQCPLVYLYIRIIRISVYSFVH